MTGFTNHPYLPSSLAGEALPPPLDIGSEPRAERDLNPPDASTVRHTLRSSPPLSGASVTNALDSHQGKTLLLAWQCSRQRQNERAAAERAVHDYPASAVY